MAPHPRPPQPRPPGTPTGPSSPGGPLGTINKPPTRYYEGGSTADAGGFWDRLRHGPLTQDDEPTLPPDQPIDPPVSDVPPQTPVQPPQPTTPVPAEPLPPIPSVPAAGGGGAGAQGGLRQALLDLIMGRINQGPVNADDPIIANQVNAFRRQKQRQFDRDRAMLAERRAAQGLSGSGAFESGLEGLAQTRGEEESSFGAGLLGQAQQARAQEIMQALTLGANYLSEQDRNALQAELANLQAGLQTQGMQLNQAQFEAQMQMQWLQWLMSQGLAG